MWSFASSCALLAWATVVAATPNRSFVGSVQQSKAQALQRRVSCPTRFKDLTAAQYVAALNPGWNLGNTLDAPEYEGAWNNPPVVASTFDDVKRSGFKSVRLPVTWHYHVNGSSPDWTLDPKWLQRVSDVVDMTLTRGLYTIVNMHHDSWIWADVTKPDANITMIEEKFYRLWVQIGQKLACKSELLAMEPINEPPGTTPEHGKQINRFNELFLQALSEAGGHNTKRVVTLVGAGEDSIKTSMWYTPPTGNYSNPIAIQYHYYSPYDFIFNAWGKTIWGSDADKSALDADLAAIRGNFTNTPLLIGEWDASPGQTETAARWKYFDFLVRTAKKYNTSTIIWDNGADLLDRALHKWRDEVAISIYLNAAKGVNNSLPDSTEDGSTTQFSSAYIFHQSNTTITDQSLPFLLNGNTVRDIIYNNHTLKIESDFLLQAPNITFRSAFLSKLYSNSSGPGIKANLTVHYSKGASSQIQVVEWDQPELQSTSSTAAAGQDLHIPVTWKGLSRPAAVRAVKSDGSYLEDDWTKWLPPLQQGRLTYGGNFNWDADSVILSSSVVADAIASNMTTVFTFEFFPRTPGNACNYTLNI